MRTLFRLLGSALLFAVMGASARAQVVVNEISYNPAGDDPTVQLEFLELYNAGSSSVDLSAWQLVFGPDPLVFPIGTSIGSHAYIVVAEKISTLQAATGYTAQFEWQGLNAGLANGGDDITLLNGTGTLVDLVVYDDSPPWPIEPDGNGPTLELINPVLDNSLASSFRASTGANGTPGAQNSRFSLAPTVKSEIPARFSAVETLTSVSVTFSLSVTGVAASNLTVKGSPATGVTGTGAGPYVFTGFAAPAAGSASIALASGAIQSGGVPFGGDTWTVSVGRVVLFHEIHYHPAGPNDDAEFVELYNAGTATVDLTGWTISDGLDLVFPAGTTIGAGGYRVVALDPALLQVVTGYGGAIAWTSGRLSNGGERLALSDAAGNTVDQVTYADGGSWTSVPDGTGPSLELIHPRLPNEYGAAWKASLTSNGTPGAANSTFDPAPAPIISGTLNTPAIPGANQSVTITATILDESTVPTATLYYRQDQAPTIAYSSTPMLDDGLHGDGAAGDRVYGAVAPGLATGQRLDFTIRASDGVKTAPGPAGHDTLVAGQFPAQTYLCQFLATLPPADFPTYHLITTQHTRDLQVDHDEDKFDATFLQCGATGCKIFFNIVERYRGTSSVFLHPHSFRVDFSNDNPLESELGFDLTKLNLMAQSVDKQFLGYQFFREAFGRYFQVPETQLARLHTNPLSHGGVQDFVYINVEALDKDFLESQGGQIVPTRFPDRCSASGATCDLDADCPVGETCVSTSAGDLYRGRSTADLEYLGTDKELYRPSYDKETNAEADDWGQLIDQCFVLDVDTTPDASYVSAVNAGVDEDAWARWFAVQLLLVNQEGGIWRDTGDDYYIYFEPDGSPNGRNAKILTWDMDSVYGGFDDAFNQEGIWRTTVPTIVRFLRNNAYAGRFVGGICDLLDTDFTQAVQDARVDALPAAVTPAARKQEFKDWVAERIASLDIQIHRTFTLTGVPASPYTDPNPVVALSGLLDQCHTYEILVNGVRATYSVFDATWSASLTLAPGPNTIVVQDLDEHGGELHRAEASVVYAPPGPSSFLRLTAPRRMLNDHTQTIEAEMVDWLGRVQTAGCSKLGSISAKRVSNGTDVPLTVTVFDPHIAVPADSIRFYNGVGSVSFTLDGGASVPPGDIEIAVTVDGVTATRIVTVVSAPVFRSLSGTLSGANLTWGPDENIRITGNATVPAGSVLTIQPGTLVMVNTTGTLNNGTLITVDGRVDALGTEDKPIHFFSERGPLAMVLTQSGEFSNTDCWQGLRHNGSSTSTYRYVFVTGAGNGLTPPRPPILRFNDTHGLVMEHSVLADNNGMGISTPGTGVITVRNTLVSRCGMGANFDGNGTTVVVEDSWFTSCGHAPEPANLDGDLVHVGGATSSQTIRRTVLADGGDDGIDQTSSSFTLENVLIHDVRDKAISLAGGSVAASNVLVYGAGIGMNGATSCTQCTISAPTPILTPTSVQKSVIWPQSLSTCAGDVDYTIVGLPSDLGCGTGNLSSDPRFASTLLCDYAPAAGSPALTAGPTGRRIGWLGFPTGTTCQTAAECDDGDPCTIDSCGTAGVCVSSAIYGCGGCATAADCDDGNPCTVDVCNASGTCVTSPGNDGAACDDGLACTEDACAAGACQGTDTCPAGSFCDASGVCAPLDPEVTLVYQNDATYTGTHDTWIQDTSPDGNSGQLDQVRWDSGSPAVEYVLLRFDGIYGTGPGQIPPGSTIETATLTLSIFNPTVAPAAEIHDAAVTWSESSATWNNYGGEAGVQADEIGAFVASAPLTGIATVDVTSSIARYVDAPSTYYGWIVVPKSTDEARALSSEWPTVEGRPKLEVTYLIPGACISSVECDDGVFCNGAEQCLGNFCQPAAAPPSCDDSILCTTDSCDAATDACKHVAVPPPAEVQGFKLARAGAVTTLSWSQVAPGTVYDIITGSNRVLRNNGNVNLATCLVDNVATLSYNDSLPPPPPTGTSYYLVRGQGACGTGTYGRNTAGVEYLPPAACP